MISSFGYVRKETTNFLLYVFRAKFTIRHFFFFDPQFLIQDLVK